MYNKITELIQQLSENSFDYQTNYNLGLEYELIGQTASAVAFYLRAAEYGYDIDKNITYSSMVKIGKILSKQGNRDFSASNALLQAISYDPKRPEAYLFLSMYYERRGEWQESYTAASIGASTKDSTIENSELDYPGIHAFNFQKAVSSWRIGRKEESKKILLELNDNNQLGSNYRLAVENNLKLFKEEMDKIAIVLPVRNNGSYRAERLKGCLSSWEEQTEGLSDLHIIIDEDEILDFQYLKDNPKYNIYIAPTGITLMQKINLVGPKLAEVYKYLAFVGDDIIFKTPWESKFIEYLSSVPAGLAFCNTVHRKDELATHPVITSNMVKALGFYGCPDVFHNYFDNFWMEVCNDIGNIKYFDDVIWDHSREGWTPDAMYWNIVNLQAEDEVRYNEYKQNKYKEDLMKIRDYINV